MLTQPRICIWVIVCIYINVKVDLENKYLILSYQYHKMTIIGSNFHVFLVTAVNVRLCHVRNIHVKLLLIMVIFDDLGSS